MKKNSGKKILFPLIAGLAIARSSLFAYIDPNTGGLLFQLLAVMFGVFSGLVLLFSSKIKQIYYRTSRRFRGSDAEEGEEETESPSD